MLLIFMCFKEFYLFVRHWYFLYLLRIVSFFIIYNTFILKRGFHLFLTGHGISHYLWSVDLSASFLNWMCQYLSFLNIFLHRFCLIERCGVTLRCLYCNSLTLRNIKICIKKYMQYKFTFLHKVFYYRVVSTCLLSPIWSLKDAWFKNTSMRHTLITQRQSLKAEVLLSL